MLNLDSATRLLVEHYTKSIGINEEIDSYILHKIRHSYDVLSFGLQIIGKDPIFKNLDKKILEELQVAILLHDIGRFYQHDGKKVLSSFEFEHANYGFGILKKIGCKNKNILYAVRQHNKFNYKEGIEDIFDDLVKENKYFELFLKIVRDADKLSNLHYITINTERFFAITGENKKNNIISNNLYKSFINKEMLRYEKLQSLNDKILNLLAWNFDIYLDGTRQIISSLNINKKLLDILKQEIFKLEDENIKQQELNKFRKIEEIILNI